MRNSRILLTSFGLVSSLFVFGCGSKDAAAPACPTFDYSKYTAPGTAGLTLTTNVAPILQRSCSLIATCHGSTAAAMAKNEPHFGTAMAAATPMELMAIEAAIVGVNSVQAPALQYVVKGDPEHSYLMKKIEGVNNCQSITCTKVPNQTAAGCGDQMPQLADPLSAADQATFRDWIKDGAKL